VLVGGSEVLTPKLYLERLTMQGDWTHLTSDSYTRGQQRAEPRTESAESGERQEEAGAWSSIFPCIFGPTKSECTKVLCCDTQAEELSTGEGLRRP
jgi:hypothetical protein